MLSERDESDLQELIGLFANAEDDATRKQMLTYMKGINVPRGYELLLKLLDQPQHQQHALEAMLTFRHRIDDAMRETIYQRAVGLLKSDNETVAILAIRLLGHIKYKSPMLFDRLLNLIEHQESSSLHFAIVETLPNVIDEVSKERHNRLNPLLDTLLSADTTSDEFKQAIEKTRDKVFARKLYQSRECVECGRGSKDIELKQCPYCDRYICIDHHHNGFCTQKHFEAYQFERTGSHNPRDW